MHPHNKRERVQVGVRKSKKRAQHFFNDDDRRNHPELIARTEHLLRNTTKLCSCKICGNPRRSYGEETLKEKVSDEKFRNDCEEHLAA